MTIPTNAYALLVSVAMTCTSAPAVASASDYAFEPVKADVKTGTGSQIAVRLVHKPTGNPVTDAVLFRSRLDMSPDGMGAMTTKHEPLPEVEPGVYRFKANLTMAGGWALKLMAKIQGEVETVSATVVFTAKD